MEIAPTEETVTLAHDAPAPSRPEPEPQPQAAHGEAEAPEPGPAGEAEPESGSAPAEEGAVEADSGDGPRDGDGDGGGDDDDGEDGSGPLLGPGQELTDDELVEAAAALLFASPQALSRARLVKLLQHPEPARVQGALDSLAAALEASPLPLEVRPISGGWRLMTSAALGDVVARLSKEPKAERISAAALETLAIVAYRQPVTNAEVEAIRGVQSGPMLRTLVDRGLVRVTGRADQPGSPLQYGTTREFLDRFGLQSLKDLPRDGELAGD